MDILLLPLDDLLARQIWACRYWYWVFHQLSILLNVKYASPYSFSIRFCPSIPTCVTIPIIAVGIILWIYKPCRIWTDLNCTLVSHLGSEVDVALAHH